MPPSTTHYTPTAAQGLPPRTFHVVAKATNALTAYCLPLEREKRGHRPNQLGCLRRDTVPTKAAPTEGPDILICIGGPVALRRRWEWELKAKSNKGQRAKGRGELAF